MDRKSDKEVTYVKDRWVWVVWETCQAQMKKNKMILRNEKQGAVIYNLRKIRKTLNNSALPLYKHICLFPSIFLCKYIF